MADSKQHASSGEGEPALLNEFIKLNPQLQEVESHPWCMNLYKLLTKKHRHQGHCEFGSRIFESASCFMDHGEYWEDMPTGLPVIIGHTYCPQHRVNEPRGNFQGDDHRAALERDAEKLAQRGLAYLASGGSWYHGNATLIVVARADVAARITLPERGNTGEAAVTRDMRQRIPEIDWEGILREKLRQEARRRDRLAQLAPAEEDAGNYQSAFYFYCDTANIDRDAGFDALAQEQLDHAKRLITNQPWLTVNYDYFATPEDRVYICGPGLPTMTREELHEKLQSAPTPDSWNNFVPTQWVEGAASADIYFENRPWGEAVLKQGGNRNLWAAKVTRYDDSMTISSIAGKNHGNESGDENHVFETIEEAVQTAVDIWTRYDELCAADQQVTEGRLTSFPSIAAQAGGPPASSGYRTAPTQGAP